MIKYFFIFLFTFFITGFVHSQELYFIQYDNSIKKYKTVRYLDGQIETVNVMPIFNFQVLQNSSIVYSNLYEIFSYSLDNPSPKKLIKLNVDNSTKTPDSAEYILSFDAAQNGNIYYELGAETYRLDKGICKLHKWSEGKDEILKIPYDMNFINFDISPDEKQIVFQHTIVKDNKNLNFLLLFDFTSSKLDTIKSDISINVDINEQFTRWFDNTIFYLDGGKLFEYDLLTKEINMIQVPIDGKIKDFEKIGQIYYFITNHNLYSWDGSQIKTLYLTEDRSDYISCLRKK